MRLLDPALNQAPYRDMIAFGDERFENGDYENALIIYQFARMKTQRAADGERLQFRIALCLELAQRWEEAERAFNDFIAVYPKSRRVPEASYRIGQGYFRGKHYEAAANYFNETIRGYPNTLQAQQAQLALGLSYAQLRMWDDSEKQLLALGQNKSSNPYSQDARDLYVIIQEGKNTKYKSPKFAALLSIIPGLGKVYTHQYGGALIAFVVNAGLGFVIYDSFENDREAVGAIFSALTAATYTANIIGGYRSAIRYNTQLEDQFSDQLLQQPSVEKLGLNE